MQDYVVLVNEQDEVLGTEEKIKAHQDALLHRAFSVFVYRTSDSEIENQSSIEFLLQQRQKDKYHCGGLWTNTCCSHPRLHEEITMAGQRRLKEELSIIVPLRTVGSFKYIAKFNNGLTEHEFDHVLVGEYDPEYPIVFDPKEVQDYCWMSVKQLTTELALRSEHYTPWLKPALALVLEDLCIKY